MRRARRTEPSALPPVVVGVYVSHAHRRVGREMPAGLTERSRRAHKVERSTSRTDLRGRTAARAGRDDVLGGLEVETAHPGRVTARPFSVNGGPFERVKDDARPRTTGRGVSVLAAERPSCAPSALRQSAEVSQPPPRRSAPTAPTNVRAASTSRVAVPIVNTNSEV
jgi:hypothetical protein